MQNVTTEEAKKTSTAELFKKLDSDQKGLSSDEAQQRLQQFAEALSTLNPEQLSAMRGLASALERLTELFDGVSFLVETNPDSAGGRS